MLSSIPRSRCAPMTDRTHKAARQPRNSLAVLAAKAWLILMLLVALGAGFLAPFGYAEQDLLARLSPPAFAGGDPAYLLGTDHLGRDVLSRLLHAIRISVIVAALGAVIGAIFGSLLGVIAGHFRGIVEDIIMGFADVQSAIPFFIFAILIIAFFGNNLVLFILIIGYQGWERYARLARGLVVAANAEGYAEAARSLGLSQAHIYRYHIAPNILGALFVQMTLNMSETIILEATLSFLGLGIQPPLTSLGLMLSDARQYIALYWWLPAVPGLAIFLSALSVSLVGDAWRDRLDASLR